MTEFNLGVLSAYATIDDAPFNAAYPRLVAKFRAMFGEATKAAAGVDKLDASLAEVADTSSAASASLSRVSTSTTGASAAQAKAAAQAKVFADAQERVNAVMAQYAGQSTRVQAAALRVAAAEERLNAVMASETATTRQLAGARAGLIGATRSLTSAQEAAAASGGVFSKSMVATSSAGKTLTHSLSLPLAAIAAVSIDVSAKFQSSMERIRTQAGATQRDVDTLTKQVLGMRDAQQGPNALADSLYHLKSVGLGNRQAMVALRAGSDLAAVGNANLEDTVNALAGAWRTGIKGAQDFGKEAALVNAIIGAGNMTLTDFTDALSTGVLASARTFGVSLKSVGAALALFTDEGVPANVAATRLRMSFSLLAAPSAKAEALLNSIGLTGTDLARDLRKPNGILAAVQDLHDHLQGLSKVDQAQLLSRAFGGGRSSSAILSMVQQVDTLGQKWDQVGGSVSKYGADVKAQQQTASAQFHRALATLERDAVGLGKDLLPVASQVVGDIDKVAKGFEGWSAGEKKAAVDAGLILIALGPVLSIVGRVGRAFVFLWTVGKGALAFSAGLRGVALAEGAVASKAYKAGTAIAAMGTRAKIASGAVAGIAAGVSFGLMTRDASRAGKALGALGATLTGAAAGFAVGGPLGAAVGAGVGLMSDLATAFIGTGGAVSQASKDMTANIDYLTAALVRSGGATNDVIRGWTAQKLEADGVLEQLGQLGVSYDTAINAALGVPSAMAKVTAAGKAQALSINGTGVMAALAADDLLKLGKANNTSSAAAKKDLAVLQASKDAHSRVTDAVSHLAGGFQNEARASASAAVAAHAASMGMEGDSVSAKKLADYLQRLTTNYQKLVNAELSQTQSQLAFKQGLLELRQQVKDYGTSLSDATLKGVQNRQNLLSLLQTNEQAAEGSKNYGATLLANVKTFQAHAKAVGYSKTAIDNLLRSEKLLPRQIEQRLHLDTSPARSALVAIMNQINALHPLIHVGITGGSTTPGHYIPPNARGGGLPEGVSSVGERGYELAVKRGPNVQIIPHGPAVAFARATGARIQGFAGGTGPGSAVGAASSALSAISGQPGSPPIDASGFTWRAFLAQLHNASTAIAKAVAAGASQHTIAGLRDRLDSLRAQGNRVERKLGATIAREATGLAHSAGTAGTSRSAVAGQLNQLEADLRRAGLPRQFIAGLTKDNTAILNAVKSRNVAAVKLAAANQAVADARKAMRADASSFGGAVTGSFDITTAGQDANGRVSRGGIIAADNQAVTRARAFVAGMRKLIGLKIFPGRYLRTLLGVGPTAANLATVQALAGMPRADIAQLAADNAALNRLGNQLGGLGAGRLDQGKVDQAQRRVDHWQKIEDRREKHLEDTLSHLGKDIADELRKHPIPIKGILKGTDIALASAGGTILNHKANRTTPRPGGRG